MVDFAVARQRAELQRLKQEFPELGAQIDVAIEKLEEFAELQKMSLAFSNISDLAGGLDQLGEAFGATKDFRIAMAMVDGGAAIISTLADPTLGVAAKIAAAAGIAAQVKQTIDQMKKVKADGGGNFTKPSTQSQFTQAISFADPVSDTPVGGQPPSNIASSSRFVSQQKIVNNIIVDRKGLAIATNRGQQELENNSVTI